jgi:hypothetical protein
MWMNRSKKNTVATPFDLDLYGTENTISVQKLYVLIIIKTRIGPVVEEYSHTDQGRIWVEALGGAKLIFLQYKLKNNLQFITYTSCFFYNDDILY